MSRSTGRLRLMMPTITNPDERRAVENYCEELLAEVRALEAEAAAHQAKAKELKSEAFRAISDLGKWARGMRT